MIFNLGNFCKVGGVKMGYLQGFARIRHNGLLLLQLEYISWYTPEEGERRNPR
ncbi:MAG: hypothetical protein PGMFKBFP_01084 [Anaerolineales bacterium]|jgi:hypothetical protein|nr:hypothetical protein [Anaerolineales bacterium]